MTDFAPLIKDAKDSLVGDSKEAKAERNAAEKRIRNLLELPDDAVVTPATVKAYNVALLESYNRRTAESMVLAQILTEDLRKQAVAGKSAADAEAQRLAAENARLLAEEEAKLKAAQAALLAKQKEKEAAKALADEQARRKAEQAAADASDSGGASSGDEGSDVSSTTTSSSSAGGASINKLVAELEGHLDSVKLYKPDVTKALRDLSKPANVVAVSQGLARLQAIMNKARATVDQMTSAVKKPADQIKVDKAKKSFEKNAEDIQQLLDNASNGGVNLPQLAAPPAPSKPTPSPGTIIDTTAGGGADSLNPPTNTLKDPPVAPSKAAPQSQQAKPVASAPALKGPALVAPSSPLPADAPQLLKDAVAAGAGDEFVYVKPDELSALAVTDFKDGDYSTSLTKANNGPDTVYMLVQLHTSNPAKVPKDKEELHIPQEGVLFTNGAGKALVSQYKGAPILYVRYKTDDYNKKAGMKDRPPKLEYAARKAYYMLTHGNLANKPFSMKGWVKFFNEKNGFEEKAPYPARVKKDAFIDNESVVVSGEGLGELVSEEGNIKALGQAVYPAAIAIRKKVSERQLIGEAIDLMSFEESQPSTDNKPVGASVNNALGADWD